MNQGNRLSFMLLLQNEGDPLGVTNSMKKDGASNTTAIKSQGKVCYMILYVVQLTLSQHGHLWDRHYIYLS